MKEIVIKIDDEVYENLFSIKPMDLADQIAIDSAIRKGKVLPKGHRNKMEFEDKELEREEAVIQALEDVANYVHNYVILSESEEEKLIGFIDRKIKEHGG